MSNLVNLLNNRAINQEIPVSIKEYLVHEPYYAEMSSRTSSRNVTDAIRQTYQQQWDSRNSTYNILSAICGYYLNKKVYLGFCNTTPKSDTTLDDIFRKDFAHDYRETQNNHNILCCYVPRGKTFLERALKENCEDVERILPLENELKRNNGHYVRVFKNFPIIRFFDGFTTSATHTVIFTDIIDADFIAKITMLLPHLLNIQPKEGKEVQFTKIMQIFEYLFNVSHEMATIDDAYFKQLFKEYEEICQFNTENMQKFTERLSTIRSNKLKQIHEQDIRRIKENITDYENTLAKFYEDLNKSEKILSAIDVAPIDVTPFVEFIKNAKTIEVLSANENKLKLRVTAPLQYFREEDYKIREENSRSQLNNILACHKHFQANDSILHKIFVTRKYKLLIQAVINLSINTSTSSNSPMYYAVEGNLSYYTQLPNPHMYHYNCWDRARNAMDKALAKNEFEIMLAQMVAAVQTVNINEDATFSNRFMDDWYNNSFTPLIHIQIDDDTILDYDEMIAYEDALLQKETEENILPDNEPKPPEATNIEPPTPEEDTPLQVNLVIPTTEPASVQIGSAIDDITQRLTELENQMGIGQYAQIEIPDEE